MGKRVAIVGSGCAGLGALYALKNTDHDVHLFEADETLGGHTNTVKFQHNGKDVDVDTGFIVYNTATYPNFIKFLEALNIETASTEMTFGVSRNKGAFEWAGTSFDGIFAQRGNLFSPRMWRMLYDVIRFNHYSLDLLCEDDSDQTMELTLNGGADRPHTSSESPTKRKKRKRPLDESIGTYLAREGYSDAFRDDYLIPMTAAVWSTCPKKAALDFPARTLIRFMWNHHLLNTITERPQWRTIPGGSYQYINALMKDFPADSVHMKRPVTGIEDINGKIILQFEEDEELFDHVILAVHGDQALDIVKDGGTEGEREVLRCFETTENVAYLHSDLSLMPRNRSTWSAWNLLTTSSYHESATRVCLTYNMNILQHIDPTTYSDVLVTLNPIHPPNPSTIQGRYHYNHPLYTSRSVRAQKTLQEIQNTRGISYCGAWTAYGFHEDGFASGVRVALDHLGGDVPWKFKDAKHIRGMRPTYSPLDLFARMVIFWVGIGISVLDIGIWVVVGTTWLGWKVFSAPLVVFWLLVAWWFSCVGAVLAWVASPLTVEGRKGSGAHMMLIEKTREANRAAMEAEGVPVMESKVEDKEDMAVPSEEESSEHDEEDEPEDDEDEDDEEEEDDEKEEDDDDVDTEDEDNTIGNNIPPKPQSKNNSPFSKATTPPPASTAAWFSAG